MRHLRHGVRYGVWALIATLMAAMLAACGGDDPEARPTVPPTALPTVPPSAQPTTAAALDYDALSRLNVGEPAPDFSLPASDGGSVALADYRGQPVLLFFHMAAG